MPIAGQCLTERKQKHVLSFYQALLSGNSADNEGDASDVRGKHIQCVV